MSRYLRSGVLWFWSIVVIAMAGVGVAAAFHDPGPEPVSQPGIYTLFDDAVDVRAGITAAIRSGDAKPLETMLNTLADRWGEENPPDHAAARSAAADTLRRMAAVAAGGIDDAFDRDQLGVDSQLLGALGASPSDPAVIELARGGFDATDIRPRPATREPVASTVEERLAAILEAGGVTTIDEVRDRLANPTAPHLSYPPTPPLDPPTAQDLHR